MSVNAVRGSPGEDDDQRSALIAESSDVLLGDGTIRRLVCLTEDPELNPMPGFFFLTPDQATDLALELLQAAKVARG